MTQNKTHGPVFQSLAPGGEFLPVRVYRNFAQGDTPHQPCHPTFRQRTKRMDSVKTVSQRNPKRLDEQSNIHRERFRLEPGYTSQIQAVNGIGMYGVHVTRARHIGGHYMNLFSAETAVPLGRPHCDPALGRKKKFCDNQQAHSDIHINIDSRSRKALMLGRSTSVGATARNAAALWPLRTNA